MPEFEMNEDKRIVEQEAYDAFNTGATREQVMSTMDKAYVSRGANPDVINALVDRAQKRRNEDRNSESVKKQQRSKEISTRLKELNSTGAQHPAVDTDDTEQYFHPNYDNIEQERSALMAERDELIGKPREELMKLLDGSQETSTSYFNEDRPDLQKEMNRAAIDFINAKYPHLDAQEDGLGVTIIGQEGKRVRASRDNLARLEASYNAIAAHPNAIGLGVAGGMVGAAAGSLLGPVGTYVGGILGGAAGSSTGAYIDDSKLFETLGIQLDNTSRAEKAYDDFLGVATIEALTLGAGKGLSVGAKAVWDAISSGGVSDDALRIMLKDTGLSTDDLFKEDKNGKVVGGLVHDWFRTLEFGQDVKVGNRKYFGVLPVPSRSPWPGTVKEEIKTVGKVKGRAPLTRNEMAVLYLLNTHKGMKSPIVSILSNDMADNPRVLLESVLERGRMLDIPLNNSDAFLPAHIVQNLMSFRNEVKTARTAFAKSLDTTGNGFDTSEAIPYKGIIEALDTNLSPAARAFKRILSSEASAELNNISSIDGRQFMHVLDNFTIGNYGGPKYDYSDLQELESVAGRVIRGHYGDEAARMYGELRGLKKDYNSLTGQAMYKELTEGHMTPDEVAGTMLKYAGSKHAKRSGKSYQQTLEALMGAVMEGRTKLKRATGNKSRVSKETVDTLNKIKKPLISDPKIGDTITRFMESVTEDYTAAFTKSSRAPFVQGNNAVSEDVFRKNLELGTLRVFTVGHSIQVTGPKNLGAGVGNRAIDFVGLQKTIGDVQFESREAKEVVDIINHFAKIYHNDLGIVAATQAAGTAIEVSSGASIATSVLGKVEVQWASAAYETILQTLASGSKYGRAAQVKKALTYFMHSDPLKVKSPRELIKIINGDK